MTPEAMRREIDSEPRLKRRPKPPNSRRTVSEQRTFDVITLRHEGLSYAEIGRRVGISGQRAKELCCRGTACRCEFCTYGNAVAAERRAASSSGDDKR